jgi:alcohol dehydrogenase class IV
MPAATGRFEFATATRIVFGEGTASEVAAIARSMGQRALLVTGGSAERARFLRPALAEVAHVPVAGEPEIARIRAAAEYARDERCDGVVAVGGGSVIDGGKALAALLTNPGDPLDYLEVIGRGQPITQPSAPMIAVPTTAGTGSEVTRNAVLASAEHHVKASLRSAFMLPRAAVVDPELTMGLPSDITAASGLDALTQLIEPYVSVRANLMTDLFCADGLPRAARALPRVWDDPSDRAARRDMAWASLLGGMSLANAALGAVHGFAAPLGGMFPAPHGAVCAALLPHVMEINVRALRVRAAGSSALSRYEQVARWLTGRPDADAEDGVEWVAALCRKLRIPPLSRYGVDREAIPRVVAQAAKASSMKGNPILLKEEELAEVLGRAI